MIKGRAGSPFMGSDESLPESPTRHNIKVQGAPYINLNLLNTGSALGENDSMNKVNMKGSTDRDSMLSSRLM